MLQKTNKYLQSIFLHIEMKDVFFSMCVFVITFAFTQVVSWNNKNHEGFHASAGVEQHIKELEIQIQELKAELKNGY